MPYIGKAPSSGEFIELDALTASATDTYTLQYNGADYKPETVNNLIVSINGVVQKPSSMSLNGSSLTVGATLSSSDTIDYIRVLGHVGSVITPTDGSVTSAKLDTNIAISGNLDVGTIRATNGTSAMTINSSGLVLPKTPILQVNALDTNQTITATVNTTVQWEAVEIDTLSGWDSSNHRYQPSVAGYYLCGGGIRFSSSSTVNQRVRFWIAKNGSVSTSGDNALSFVHLQFNFNSDIIANSTLPLPTGLIQLNGSSDYVSVIFETDETINIHDSTFSKSYFFAQLVHAT